MTGDSRSIAVVIESTERENLVFRDRGFLDPERWVLPRACCVPALFRCSAGAREGCAWGSGV